MTFRKFTLFVLLSLLSMATLKAQGCYEKALKKGQHFKQIGKKEKARMAWENGKKCPDTDIAVLDNLIQSLYDEDLDGVPDTQDACPSEHGTKNRNGCPCFEQYRMLGIDFYYDSQPEKAAEQFELAKQCDDAKGGKPIAEWETRLNEKPLAYASDEDKSVRTKDEVEQKPEFLGGEEAMLKLVSSNIRYPVAARDNEVEGIAHIEYIVEKDGTITHLNIKRDVGKGIGAEALRLVKMFPSYAKPGMIGGKPVRTKMIVPVKFQLV